MGSKSQPKPPDYTQLADVSREGLQFARDESAYQREFSQRQYEETKPMFDRLVNQQEAMSQQNMDQANAYYQHWNQNARPMEERLANEATRFNTEAYREQLAQQAMADAQTAFSNTKNQNARGLASMGVNPNSGKAMATNAATTLMQGAQTAAMMNNTRNQAEQTGYARQLDATGLFRGMPGAASGAYASALNAGNSLGGNALMGGNNYMAGRTNAAGIMSQGIGQASQNYGNIMNNQGAMYGTQMASNAEASAGIGSLVGGIAGSFLGPIGTGIGAAIGKQITS